MTLVYGSVCSGIEAASVAWAPLGWRAAWFAEIEAFPQAVLRHRYGSNVLAMSIKRRSAPRREGGIWNLGDFTTIRPHWLRRLGLPTIDLLVGGTPCQSFSVAGQRAGLDDPRGVLTLEFLALARRLRPRWLVWENVPGVLSSDGGRDFGAVVGTLGQLRYGWAYRILDAQHFGVPQRRRRLFLVGHLGDWRPAAAVLFERESLRRDPAPGREAGEGLAPTLSARPRGGGGLGTDADCGGGLIADPVTASYDKHRGAAAGKDSGLRNVVATLDASFGRLQGASSQDLKHDHSHLVPYGGGSGEALDVATACNAKGGAGRMDFESETLVAHALRGEGFDASEDGTVRGTPLVAFSCKDYAADAGALSPPLRALGHDKSHPNAGGQVAVALAENQRGELREMGVAPSLNGSTGGKAGRGYSAVADAMTVRRLTPRECERLQAFPDDYTRVPYGGRPACRCPDGPRYKAIGNSKAVPVVRWIGRRLDLVHRALLEARQ